MNRSKPTTLQGEALEVSQILRARREQAGMSQRVLAGRLGVTPASVCYYESGKRMPSMATLMKIKNVLEFSIRDCINIIEAISNGEQEDKDQEN